MLHGQGGVIFDARFESLDKHIVEELLEQRYKDQQPSMQSFFDKFKE